MYKHERITLVVLAYVIGFSTAYIAFNFVNPGHEHKSVGQYAHLHDSQGRHINPNTKLNNRTVEQQKKQVSIEKNIDGFFALIEGRSRILSAQAISATDAVEGFHFEVHNSAVSPNGNFIHYCAQLKESDTTCKHYIYEIASDVVYRVKIPNGNHLESNIRESMVTWTVDDLLVAGDYTSISGIAPWNLSVK